MAFQMKILKPVVAALLLVAVFFAMDRPVHAGEAELLAELKTAPESDAKRLERELALIWDSSGSPAMDLLLKRGREALEQDDSALAIEHFSALTDHAPEFAEGWHARATAFYQAGLYGPALDALERALALNPNNFNAIFGLGVMFQEFGDLERAVRAYAQVLELHPHHENAKAAMERLENSGIRRTL